MTQAISQTLDRVGVFRGKASAKKNAAFLDQILPPPHDPAEIVQGNFTGLERKIHLGQDGASITGHHSQLR
ncbi:hypothetical protein BH20VER3_BH20VER3_00760 [soil metagenome]